MYYLVMNTLQILYIFTNQLHSDFVMITFVMYKRKTLMTIILISTSNCLLVYTVKY